MGDKKGDQGISKLHVHMDKKAAPDDLWGRPHASPMSGRLRAVYQLHLPQASQGQKQLPASLPIFDLARRT